MKKSLIKRIKGGINALENIKASLLLALNLFIRF